MKYRKLMGYMALGLLIAGMFATVAIPLMVGMAATDRSSTGTFTMNAAPSVTDVDFNTDAYAADEALDPVTVYQRLNFTVSTSATMSDLLNCTIWIYDDSTHGGDYNATAVDGIFLVQFLWVEATDTWTVNDQGAMTEWAVDNSAASIDPGTASGSTQYEFSMRFNISQVARADTTDWNATVHVYDDDAGTAEWDYASEGTLVTMNDYFGLTISTSTFAWGNDIQPSSTNNTHGALTIQAYGNTAWELRISASNFTASAETDVTPETEDVIAWDEDGSNDGISMWIRNTTATLPTGSTWDAQSAMSDESGVLRNVYIFLSPQSLFAIGKLWSVIITIYIQADA